MKAYSIIRRKTKGAGLILLLFVASGIFSMLSTCAETLVKGEITRIETNV